VEAHTHFTQSTDPGLANQEAGGIASPGAIADIAMAADTPAADVAHTECQHLPVVQPAPTAAMEDHVHIAQPGYALAHKTVRAVPAALDSGTVHRTAAEPARCVKSAVTPVDHAILHQKKICSRLTPWDCAAGTSVCAA